MRLLFLLLASFFAVRAQTLPVPLLSTVVPNISSSATYIDNRSTSLRANTLHTFHATGSGTWSVQLQYSDVSPFTGPWTNFPDASSVVSNATTGGNGTGTGYHAYLRFSFTGTAFVNYAGTKNLYFANIASVPGLSSLNGLIGATQTFATGSSGSDFGISSVGTTHTFNIPTASVSNRGLLGTADFASFTAKAGTSSCGANQVTIQITTAGAICISLTTSYLPGTVVLTSGAYADPAWITSLAYGKLTGVPSTFTPSAHASTHATIGSDPVSGLTEVALSLSDVVTGNASAARHGFLPKWPNDNTKCFLGDGTYGTCPGGGGGGAATSLTTSTIAGLPGTSAVSSIRWVTDATVSNGGTRIFVTDTVNTWSQFGYVDSGGGDLAFDCTSLPCLASVTATIARRGSANTWTSRNDFSGATTIPDRQGTGSPAGRDPCTKVGESYFQTDAPAGSNTFKCVVIGTPGSWALQGGSGIGVDSVGYYAPFSTYAVNTTGLYAGDTPGPIVATRFVSQFSASFTRYHMYNGSAPGAGKAVLIGIYNSTGTTLLAWGRVVNPNGHAYVSFNTTLSLVAGTTYLQVVAAEAEFVPAAMNVITGVGGLFTEAGSSKNLHWNCAESTAGTNTTYVLPSTCVVQTTTSYYSVPTIILLP